MYTALTTPADVVYSTASRWLSEGVDAATVSTWRRSVLQKLAEKAQLPRRPDPKDRAPKCKHCDKAEAHTLGCFEYATTCRCCLGCSGVAVWLVRDSSDIEHGNTGEPYCSDCVGDEEGDDTESWPVPAVVVS